MMRSSVWIAALVLTSAHVVGAAPSEAEQAYEQGQAAFDAGRFGDAVVAWERSYELSKEPVLLFNLGQAYRQRHGPGDCAKALAAYKRFIELVPEAVQRPLAEGFI